MTSPTTAVRVCAVPAAAAVLLASLGASPAAADTCAGGTASDFDGDGIPDLVIGDPDAPVDGNERAGRITVAYGGEREPALLERGTGAVPGEPGQGDRFGEVMDTFDHDGDGCADLIVGLPYEEVDDRDEAGAVMVVHGSPDGLGQGAAAKLWDQDTAGFGGGPEAGDWFGHAVAAGNAADGTFYAVIGIPGESVGDSEDAGYVQYVRGDHTASFHQDTDGVRGTVEVNDRYGFDVAAGDTLIAVGAPGEAIGSEEFAGTVHLFNHEQAGDRPDYVGDLYQDSELPGGVSGASEAGDRTSTAVDAIDYRTAGGVQETMIAVGSPGEDLGDGETDTGGVHVFRSEADGTRSQVLAVVRNTGGMDLAQSSGFLGQHVRLVDTAPGRNATDTSVKLVAGTPGHTVGEERAAGLAQVFHPLTGTVDERIDLDRSGHDALGDPVAGGHFGMYDPRGRQVAVHDPDTGTTTSVYDDLDQLVSTTDANGTTVSYVYDGLGRRVQTWEGAPGEGTKLTSYQYDTRLKGQLFIQTRHTPEGDFRIGIVGQDRLDRPTNILYGVPDSQGALAGNYEFSISYNVDGTVQGMGLPAAGGLSAESTVIEYDEIGRPVSLSGDDSYVTRTEYNQLGQVLQMELAAGSGPKAWITNEFEKGTQRLLGTRVDRQGGAAPLLDTGYTYDDAGNVLSVTDSPEGGATETQCFTYDPLLQLTEAWTLPHEDPGGCDAAPTASSVGGPAAYWHSYEYDDAGNRVSETLHGVTGAGNDAVRDYTYPDQGQDQPNTVREVVEQTPQGDTLSVFDYDAAGNTVVRELAGERQELSWTPEGRLDTVSTDAGDTSFTYTADGDRLMYSTPEADTLYLPGMELRADRFTGEVEATRYYEHGGQTVAVRTPDRLDLLASDHQGTGQVAMDADSEQSVRRYLTPFGEGRGSSGGAWPDDKGFLGKTVDASTGLTLVGAREYDAALGRFISADPVVDPSDPLQMNGYAYANNSPLTFSDPTGLWLSNAWDKVKSGASKVGKAVKSGYKSTKKWVKKNKSTIVSVGVGIAVGVGCTALTGGAGAIGCAALGGAVSGLVQYGMDTPRNNWSWGGAATATVIGGALGAAGGAIGGRIAGAIGSRFSSWASSAGSRSGASSWARWGAKPRTPQPPPPPKPPRPTPTSTTPRPAPVSSAPTSAARGGCKNSFVPGTGVLMADGSTKAIEDVEVGDEVVATDPETGEQGARTVAATIVGEGAKTLVQITVDPTTEREAPEEGESAGSESASEIPGPVAVGDVIVATDGHPFWVPELDAWVDAVDLAPGMWLQTSSGTWVQVSAVEVDTQIATVRNLTVTDLHTYHVAAGENQLLNHNCGGELLDRARDLYGTLGEDSATVAVARVSSGGKTQTWVATNLRGIPDAWRGGNSPLSGTGEIFKPGVGHAEQTIMNSLRPGQVLEAMASSTRMCSACFNGAVGRGMSPSNIGMGRGVSPSGNTPWRVVFRR
ncbi:hypothetical protein A6A08_20610 [Nocardiopsis sp. TSRI0078]|uniref:RHS repeat-associated core domain-containing protein n=1 Tax=unclassified Nocardiopsis TaxID=2649073 RepID=UPI000938C5DA|nr:RHS repeat-associated core domain-containing protein [Nocardiopsis sp. TSRI0078]OKI21985.1 hypothetical protein A6A08_20610 [Nocardiopsis sp. TSRI0078]